MVATPIYSYAERLALQLSLISCLCVPFARLLLTGSTVDDSSTDPSVPPCPLPLPSTEDLELLIDRDYSGSLQPPVAAAIKRKWSRILGPDMDIVVGTGPLQASLLQDSGTGYGHSGGYRRHCRILGQDMDILVGTGATAG